MEPRGTGPAHLLRLSRLAGLEAPRDQSHPEVLDPPLYPMGGLEKRVDIQQISERRLKIFSNDLGRLVTDFE